MRVCYGGNNPFAARGGTTLGNTFLSRQTPVNGQTDPRILLSQQRYQELMEHEGDHVKQFQTLGPLMVTYFLMEPPMLPRAPGVPPGCMNLFEWSADFQKGGYPC